MNQPALKQDVEIKDISREPRVRPQNAPRKITHTIALIPSNYVQTLWDDVENYLAPAIARSNGRWDMQSLYESIRNMEQNLWVAFNEDNVTEGVATTEFVFYPKRKMLAMQYLGGKNFNGWVWDMLEKFNGWAKDNECDGIEGTARHGFWKWLEQDGFKRSYTVYEKGVSR
tara:strand:+ start:2386 stop:2898 length:513 start_codon:yes stop_codon:yes gene_type:complete